MMLRFLMMCVFFIIPLSPLKADLWESMTSLWKRPAAPCIPTIKILAAHGQSKANVEVIGRYRLYDPRTGEHLSTRFIGKRNILQALPDGIKWGEEFPGLHQITFVPFDGGRVIIDGVEFIGFASLYNIGGAISIVDEVAIEDYLATSLTKRYPYPLPEEVLAAIVLTARTQLYYFREYPSNPYWSIAVRSLKDLELNEVNPEVAKALQATRRMVLSRTSLYEGELTPFPAIWPDEQGSFKTKQESGVVAKIDLKQAEELAKKGEHAAQILSKAFPGASIRLVDGV